MAAPLLPLAALALVVLVGGTGKRRAKTSDPAGPHELDRGSLSWIDPSGADMDGWHADDALWDAIFADSLGWPYIWAKGAPNTPWSQGRANGVDCCGYAVMTLVEAGVYPENWPDLGVSALLNCSDPIALGDQRPGDVAWYPGHVMMVASGPNDALGGHSWVQGASNGGRQTTTPTPGADVHRRKATYRRDLGATSAGTSPEPYARINLDKARAYLTGLGYKLPAPRFRVPGSSLPSTLRS